MIGFSFREGRPWLDPLWPHATLPMRQVEVPTDAVQVFGGYGYMKDYPVEELMRDARLLQIYEGTNQMQRTLIARHTNR